MMLYLKNKTLREVENMKIMKDGIDTKPSKNESPEYAPDELVEKISAQMEEKYKEALKLLAKGPDSNENS